MKSTLPSILVTTKTRGILVFVFGIFMIKDEFEVSISSTVTFVSSSERHAPAIPKIKAI
jgi:hypothetical protein